MDPSSKVVVALNVQFLAADLVLVFCVKPFVVGHNCHSEVSSLFMLRFNSICASHISIVV